MMYVCMHDHAYLSSKAFWEVHLQPGQVLGFISKTLRGFIQFNEHCGPL